jgi:hypothetical protein
MRALARGRWSSIAMTLAVALGAMAAAAAAAPDADPDEVPFLTENRAAMDRMMAGMDVKPTGDVDRDFAALMIPHHRGAIDMAQAELRYGKNELLRRMAQEIIVQQQQEIAAMNLAVGQPLPPPAPAPDQPSDLWSPAAPPASMPMMNMQPPQKEP